MARTRNNSAFWAAHLEAIRREATSKTEYAKRHGISVKRLYYWQRKLKESHANTVLAGQPKTFVSLRVEEPAPHRSSSCTLVLGGMRLEMSALPAPTWLAALVKSAQGSL
jgi:transposase-like protein